LPRQGVSDKDQAEVQSNMQSKVLESSRYPAIVFQSTQVRRNHERVKVSGDLTPHGTTKPVTPSASSKPTSEFRLRQI